MIFNTDILSMLGKIGRADLLRKLFPEESLVITFEVYNELLRAKEVGYEFVNSILEQGFNVIYLDLGVIKEYEQKKSKLRTACPASKSDNNTLSELTRSSTRTPDVPRGKCPLRRKSGFG
uniref:Uncharacterized protein n=1 Tax=Candidatus Methanophagaceae archaeon ANME-1 ERB6 TaxID=2759912 RepID=A0A7G9YRU3_9EURY|nr:hypothetical protein EGEIMDOP_00012 [Methanosarcinales archaeon ANME-1 ERB6]